MKKELLFAILLTISPAVLSEVIIPELPTSDIEGGKDLLFLKRYVGSYIVAQQHSSYSEFTFPLSKLKSQKSDDASTGWATFYTFAEKKTVEGPYTRLVYFLPADRSPLEVVRNYRDEVLAEGGNVLFECKREECGGKKGKSITNKQESLASFLRPRERLGLDDYTQGFCATTGDIIDQRYLVADLPDTGTYISVHTYSIDSFHYTNCNAFKGRTIAVVDIVEGKAREKNMIKLEASDMGKAISSKGSVSLYGILFDTNSSSVKVDSEATLLEITKLLKDQPDLKLLVVGHTDNAGAFEYNMDLSQNRARSVVDELSKNYGVSKERLVPFGASYASPVASNATTEGQALNRRVELVENRAQ